MLIIQVIIVLSALYAITRTLQRFRTHAIGTGELLLWLGFWVAVGVLVIEPQITQWFARLLGVGRGADAVFYLSIVGLSYLFFRLYLRTRELEQQLTRLVRELAIQEAQRRAEATKSSGPK